MIPANSTKSLDLLVQSREPGKIAQSLHFYLEMDGALTETSIEVEGEATQN